MFITTSGGGYTRDGQQWARGLFLVVLASPFDRGLRPELRGIVRHVALSQLGHFMMGFARIGADRVTVSGAYGGDGLPLYKTDEALMARLWARAVPLPLELAEAFWSGGGHNCAGNEAPSMRTWALENLKTLRG